MQQNLEGHERLYCSTVCCLRVVHGSDGPAGRVGSSRVGSGHDFAGFWRVGSGQIFFTDYFLVPESINKQLNRYESSNTTFGLIDFLRYSTYNNLIINKYLFNQRMHCTYGGKVGPRVGSDFCRQSRVGSGQCFAGSGRV